MKFKGLVLACAGVAALGASGFAAWSLATPDPIGEIADFQERRVDLPDLKFIDHEGRPVSFNEDLAEGHLLVVNFNYTTCESICPVGNQIMALVDRRLEGRAGRPVRLVSIAIDPATDTPEKLREARAAFEASGRWFWLTGGRSAIDAILSAFDAQVYDIELHDPVFLVGDPAKGRFVKSLSMPDPDELLLAIERFDA